MKPRMIGIAAAVVLSLGGCSKFTEPFRDAPRGVTNT